MGNVIAMIQTRHKLTLLAIEINDRMKLYFCEVMFPLFLFSLSFAMTELIVAFVSTIYYIDLNYINAFFVLYGRYNGHCLELICA